MLLCWPITCTAAPSTPHSPRRDSRPQLPRLPTSTSAFQPLPLPVICSALDLCLVLFASLALSVWYGFLLVSDQQRSWTFNSELCFSPPKSFAFHTLYINLTIYWGTHGGCNKTKTGSIWVHPPAGQAFLCGICMLSSWMCGFLEVLQQSKIYMLRSTGDSMVCVVQYVVYDGPGCIVCLEVETLTTPSVVRIDGWVTCSLVSIYLYTTMNFGSNPFVSSKHPPADSTVVRSW